MSVGLIYAIHGFLGQGTDWDSVKQAVSWEWQAPSLFSPGEDSGQDFADLKNFSGKKIFVGYSLGGRIGLSVLQATPELFDHYIFVSVNPGFGESEAAARNERWLRDQEWAQKLETLSWKHFLTEWNSQAVFEGGQNEPERSDERYDRKKLKKYLTDFSLSKQPDYRPVLKQHRNKITWVVGEKDKKFLRIAESLLGNGIINEVIKIKSGHRIPFDSPKKLSEIINSVIEKI